MGDVRRLTPSPQNVNGKPRKVAFSTCTVVIPYSVRSVLEPLSMVIVADAGGFEGGFFVA